jgi:hypothetical protein
MNAIMMSRITAMSPNRLPLVGRYDAGDLQRAMRVALGRAHLRMLRGDTAKRSPLGCDMRADGRRVEL